MKISEVIKKLETIKEEHGDINVIYGFDDCTVEYVEPVKYIIRYNEFHQERQMDTEDLDQDYLEKSYSENDILDSGIVAKIY